MFTVEEQFQVVTTVLTTRWHSSPKSTSKSQDFLDQKDYIVCSTSLNTNLLVSLFDTISHEIFQLKKQQLQSKTYTAIPHFHKKH